MDAATCLVLPSRSEGLGRVILESFARGRSVVASRVGGVADVVEDGETGFLVEVGDAEALADALTRVLSDRSSPRGSVRRRTTRRRGCSSSADDYAARVRSLVDRTLTGARQRAARLRDSDVDAEDPILGATVAKLTALAQRCDELVVITDRVGLDELPANCVVRTFGAPDEARPRAPLPAGARALARCRGARPTR